MSIKSVYNIVKDYLVIFFGLVIYSIGWQGFIFPHDITTGGLAGAASLISWSTGINVSIPYNGINGILIILAIFILGWRFSVKTVFSVVFLMILIPLANRYFGEPLLKDEPFMSVIIGSIMCGLSLGMVFSVNGSTGGTDIIAAIINKYRNLTIGRALMVIDVIIIGTSYFIFKSPEKLVFSICEVLICNVTLDYFLNGYRQSVQFFIISPHYREISQRVIQEVNRGCTIIDAHGAYSSSDIKIMLVIAKKTESQLIFRAVKEIDPKAFITQSLVRGVYGEGFDKIKLKERRKQRDASARKLKGATPVQP